MAFCGKNVVITGGFGAIASEVCKCFLKKKILNLAILDIKENQSLIEKLSTEYPATKIVFFKLDITNKSNIDECFEKTLEEFKFIDFVINCAGIVNENDPERVISTNLTGVILATLKAIDCMTKEKGGRGGFIANVASTVGLEPAPTHSIYAASKHGVVGFTRSISSELYHKFTGITINTICPGKTNTGFIDTFGESVTLECGRNYAKKLIRVKGQTAEQCADIMLQAFEKNKNGAVWMCDQGELTEVTFPQYWTPESI